MDSSNIAEAEETHQSPASPPVQGTSMSSSSSSPGPSSSVGPLKDTTKPRYINPIQCIPSDEFVVRERNSPGGFIVDPVELQRMEMLSHMAIPRIEFMRQVRSTMQSIGSDDIKFQTDALELLQLNTENMLVDFFAEVNVCSAYRDQDRVSVKDLRLANRILGNPGPR